MIRRNWGIHIAECSLRRIGHNWQTGYPFVMFGERSLPTCFGSVTKRQRLVPPPPCNSESDCWYGMCPTRSAMAAFNRHCRYVPPLQPQGPDALELNWPNGGAIERCLFGLTIENFPVGWRRLRHAVTRFAPAGHSPNVRRNCTRLEAAVRPAIAPPSRRHISHACCKRLRLQHRTLESHWFNIPLACPKTYPINLLSHKHNRTHRWTRHEARALDNTILNHRQFALNIQYPTNS